MSRLFTWMPDWRELKRTLRVRSSVTRLLRGGESRRSHAARPLTDFKFSLSLTGDAAAAFRLWVDTLDTDRVRMPDWCHGGRVLSASGTQVQVEPGSPVLNLVGPGDRVLMRRSWRASEELTVAAVTGETVELAGPITTDILGAESGGVTLWPLLEGELEDLPKLARVDDRSFRTEVSFREEPPEASVVESMEPSFSTDIKNVYFLLYVDSTGSMPSAQLTAIQAAFAALKVLIRDQVYGGDQALADEYVRYATRGGEDWLEWMALTVSGELSSRYFVAAFINESSSGYHRVPRNLSLEPTASWLSDYALMQAEFERREFSVGRVYAVDPGPGSSWEDDYDAFRAQVADAIAGVNGYAPLSAFNISLMDEIQADESAEFYFNDMLNAVQAYGAI